MAKVVVKIGGDVLENEARRQGLLGNVLGLLNGGHQLIIVHGGGPQMNALQEALGRTPHKVGGRRVTSKEDLILVHQAICGEVNVALCSLLLDGGVPAFGCHGASGRLIGAVKRPPTVVSGGPAEPVDFGEVGDVADINGVLLEGLLKMQVVPVIATLGVEAGSGRTYNINADTTAVRVAQAVGADALLLTTGIGAIFRDIDDPSSRIEEVTEAEARQLIVDGVIVGGMIPKVEEALEVLGKGVKSIAICDPQDKASFLAAIRGDAARGTRILP